MDLENLFCKEIEKLGELEDNPTIAIAVSGGIDSIVLTFLANKWIKTKSGKIIAITIDHALRAESSLEGAQIHAYLTSFKIEHHIVKWDHSNEKIESNIQSKAREARYKLLTEWCKRNNVIHLMLAHHKDDQAETFMLRLERGSGLIGLSSMAATSIKNNVRIVRPLLNVNKQDLIEYANKNNLSWVEDPSNQSDKYRRNFIRKNLQHDLLFSNRIANTAKNLGRARASFEKICAEHMVRSVAINCYGYGTIDIEYYRKLSEEEGLFILAQTLKTIGLDIINPRLESLSKLYNILKSDSMNYTVTLAGCKIIRSKKHNSKILIFREIRKKQPIIEIKNNIVYFDRKFKLTLPKNKELLEYKIDFLSNQLWNKIIKIEKKFNNLIPKEIVHTLPAIYINSELIAIPIVGYYKTEDSKKISCFFNPHNTLTKNLFNYC